MTTRSQNPSPEESEHSRLKTARLSVEGYTFCGTVVHGNHLGTTLGFPTANIETFENRPPAIPNGVYLVGVKLKDGIFSGLCNIGYRPTVGGKHLVIEVNIFDFAKDIYGEDISVIIISAIRKERKFKDLEQLVNQIRIDKAKAIKIISALNKNKTG